MRHDDDHHLPLPGRWESFANYHGRRSAEACWWACFWARVTGDDVDQAIDLALLKLDRERHDR